MAKQTGAEAVDRFPECLKNCQLNFWVDPVACLDGSGEIVFVNRQFSAWFGEIGSAGELLARLEARIASRLLQLIQRRSRRSAAFFGAGKGHDGGSIRFDLDFMPLPSKKRYQYLLHFYDSSRNLALYRQSLEMEKYHSLVTLTAGITHNFNNILAGIKGYAGLMRQWLDDGKSPIAAYAVGIERLAERGADVNRRLLSFAGRERSLTAPVEVNALLQEVIEKMAPLAERQSVSIEASPMSRRMYFMGDRFQLMEAMENLLLNAVESYGGQPGRVTIQAAMKRRRVSSSDIPQTSEMYQAVQLTIADSGRGMSDDEVSQAFEPFFTTKQTSESLGLGLPVALGIIQAHGGEIRLASKRGRGTTVKIFLPAYTLPAVEATAGMKKARKSQPRKKAASVLVVDDEPDILEIMQRILGELGLRVIPAKSGEEALESLVQEGQEIRLVILDMVLEDMSGIEIFQQIRRLLPNLPVLFVSGQDYMSQNRDLLSQGAAGFIGKPFSLKDLQKKVIQILQLEVAEEGSIHPVLE
jgi:two-component system, cell cycle sensor histidine kinase and response regulator CckA